MPASPTGKSNKTQKLQEKRTDKMANTALEM